MATDPKVLESLKRHSEITDKNGNFFLANEYLDFIEFLDNELGFDKRKELQSKFYASLDKQAKDWQEKEGIDKFIKRDIDN